VAEYTGQIRAWFYVLHVISTALFDSIGFKNVLVEGVLLGTDGRKMSKNYGNFPDPKMVMQKYGGDAVRIYLLGSPLMKGEDISFSNDGVPEVVRGFLLILWNSYKYFIDYASIFNWSCDALGGDAARENLTVLDKWILARLTQLVQELNKSYEHYDTVTVVKSLREFIVNDFSTWYIRRNRDRVSNNENIQDRNVCLSVMYGVLVGLTKAMAPLAPFIAEEMYRNLTEDESVHLTDFPKGDASLLDKELIEDMKLVREVVERGHSKRKESNLKLRQPLSKVIYNNSKQLSSDLEQIIAEELNVKEVVFGKKAEELTVELDIKVTPQLAKEGQARDIIRDVQKMRKEQNLTLKDKIELGLPEWPEEFEEMIKKMTNAVSLKKDEHIQIQTVDDR
jgi:isoleucyl-tRNA synthetase